MTFLNAPKLIESTDFSIKLNLVGDFKGLLKAVRQETAVKEIYSGLDDPNNINYVINRILDMSHSAIDRRFENPWDIALFVYLWLLDLKNQELGRVAAIIINETPHCWWAEKLAHQILNGHTRSDNISSPFERGWHNVSEIEVRETADSGEVILNFRFSLNNINPEIMQLYDIKWNNFDSTNEAQHGFSTNVCEKNENSGVAVA